MLLFHSVVIAQGLSIAVSAESNAWRNTTTATSATSTSRSLPLNIKPPLPLGNGSTYSILPSTGTIPATFSATATRNASITASANLATYGNYTFSTICPSGNSGCMSSCQAFANSCHKEFDAWSTARNSFQSSIVDESNSGVMPVTNSYYVITGTPSTSYEYNTSWIMNRWTSSLPGWAAADNGYTTIVDGATTRTEYISGYVPMTFTSLTPVAEGGSGIPVSTRTGYESTITRTVTSYYPYTEPRPTCSPTSWTQCRYKAECTKCTISGGTVQLLYFPVSATYSTDTVYANYTATTITAVELHNITATATTPAPTGIETAIYKNFTLTSPSVYISFETAYAQNECGTQVGSRYPGAILPLPLSDLSSVYGGYGTLYSSNADPFASATPYLAAGQFNLEDMNWPPPMSAYTNQLKFALGREIFSVMTKPYNPHLAVPAQIRSLDPKWNSCELDWEGLYDPPTALTPVQNAATPTLPTKGGGEIGAETTAAEPVSTGSSVAVETGMPSSSASEDVGGQVQPTGTSVGHGLGKTNENVEPTRTKTADSVASSPVVVTSDEQAGATSFANLGSLIGAVASALPQDVEETVVPGSASFTYDPEETEETAVTTTASKSIDIGGIIISALGGAAPHTTAHTDGAGGAGGGQPAESAPTTPIASAQDDPKVKTHATTITSPPSWTLAKPSGVVIVFGSSQYTAVQSVGGEIVVDKTATITAGGAALTLPGGSNGGTLSMQSDGRLIMGNTVQGTGGTLLVDPKETHELITASDVKATASDPSTYGDAVNGDTALVAFGSTTWTASKVSQGVQLSPGVVLATDSTMTTAGKTIWLAAGDGIVVASGTSRTTIGFKSASDQHPSTAGPTGKQSRTSAVTTSATSSVETASQGDCPYWTTCISESTVGTIVDAATATATGGAQTLICRTAWSLTAALCSIVASWLV